MSEPVIMWAVKRPDGHIDATCLRHTDRNLALAYFGSEATWNGYRHDGYSLVKVEVREVGDE